jgi:hypothetical protein
MKSEMIAARDCIEIERLGCGKIRTKTDSKFFPKETVLKMGEQFEIEMPNLGTIRGIVTENKDTLMTCMKFSGKCINIKEKYSGDFVVQECEVDGCSASRMKVIQVRN